jgi:ATP synthase protein I
VVTSTEAVGALTAIDAPAPAEVADVPSPVDNGMDGYLRLQRRLLLSTVCATALAVPLTALWFDRSAAVSLLVGALAGLLYLRLLSRSVSRFGVATKSMGKVQLLVPVVLVLAAARLPALDILPALVGFLLYKPALIVQAVLDT